MPATHRIVVIGLGYVGLPLAVALARKFDVVGFDIDPNRIGEVRENFDRTGEVDADTLAGSSLELTNSTDHCVGGDVYIVTVPTPVDAGNRPDLTAVLAATRLVAAAIDPARRPTVVFEGTVYPGVTEDICGPRSSVSRA
jgi:UDP-N-acetyl-D-glucosamine/UDP-N-acetyl-D-galactosamine dehydrogenase